MNILKNIFTLFFCSCVSPVCHGEASGEAEPTTNYQLRTKSAQKSNFLALFDAF